MKLGIVTSGNDNLALFNFLNKYDHEYIVYYDFSNWPYGDKGFAHAQKEVEKGIAFLKARGMEKVIVPPVFELASKDDIVLPLFQTYLLDHCFSGSLIGKIGYVGDFVDMEMIEEFSKKLAKKYTPTDNQKNIKKFSFPFAYRTKQVTLRKYFLMTLSYSEYMVNKTVKFDLRYFKDANVDTLIPLNYGYFNYEKTIYKYFNTKKTKFHKLAKVEKCFLELVSKTSKKYSVEVCYTGHCGFIKNEKRLLWLLGRGKGNEVSFEEVK